MSAFFDSPPTTQSRLLTFRCPSYQQGAGPNDHLITIAWKAKDSRHGAEVMVLAENMAYRGKTLVLTPGAIKGQKLKIFPAGTFFTTCTCLPRKDGKVCYIATETIDNNRMQDNLDATKIRPAVTSERSTKKISKDLQASTQILIQLYDFLEEFTAGQKRAQADLLRKIELLEQRYLEVVAQNLSNKLSTIESKLLYLEQKITHSNEHLQRQLQTKIYETHCYLNVLLARLVKKERPTDNEISDFEKVLLKQRPSDEKKILAVIETASTIHLDLPINTAESSQQFDISEDATVMVSAVPQVPVNEHPQVIEDGEPWEEDFVREVTNGEIDPELAMILEDQPGEDDEESNYQGMGVTKIMESARFKAITKKTHVPKEGEATPKK